MYLDEAYAYQVGRARYGRAARAASTSRRHRRARERSGAARPGARPSQQARGARAAAERVRAHAVRRPAPPTRVPTTARAGGPGNRGAPVLGGTARITSRHCGAAERPLHELLRRPQGSERRAVEAAVRHRGRGHPRGVDRRARVRVRGQGRRRGGPAGRARDGHRRHHPGRGRRGLPGTRRTACAGGAHERQGRLRGGVGAVGVHGYLRGRKHHLGRHRRRACRGGSSSVTGTFNDRHLESWRRDRHR